jgi:DNA-binding Lrp family transcriptional regulator
MAQRLSERDDASGVGRLSALDRRIISALQIRPRATWAMIADALNEPARSITRRGSELIATGTIRVVGVNGPTRTALAFGRPVINTTRTVLRSLAARPDCVFAYALTGQWPVLAELRVDDEGLENFLLDELPATPGLADLQVHRASRVLRSVREWVPDILAPEEQARLGHTPERSGFPVVSVDPDISAQDRQLLRLLMADGRTPTAELAARTRLSENTVRRRLAWLEDNHYSRLRVVVEPEALGFAHEAIVRLDCVPGSSAQVADSLLRGSAVRYLVALGSDDTLLAHVVGRSLDELHTLISSSDWTTGVRCLESAHLVAAAKRSGHLRETDRRGRSLY